MNAVEIEEAVSSLAEQPFDAANFPYAFLEAFGNKATTIQRLRSGSSNKSDIDGGVLQYNNIHMAIAPKGEVGAMLTRLRESQATKRQKAKFILATDGKEFQAEDLNSDMPPVICEYKDFADHFGFFLPLAGISTVRQIRESSFDIKATGRLNRLYVELLKDNPKWGTAERRHDMNHFMARLIFCFFAEDTDIFKGEGLFSKTVEQMSERDSSNTHEVIGEIFRAMNTDLKDRAKAKLPRWIEDFPYVNGGLFSGSTDVPKFSKIARSFLIHIGALEWKKINPDIFGSMIQAVTEDEERGALGMHYTSVPNILRVLNPLFLDDLRSQLEKAGDNARSLLNLRKRISKIRVFDPACGSGNFLVIAYKEMRAIEAEINKRRKEPNERTEIELTNFRGIELRDFPAEIARLALIIAEYQCNVLYIGQLNALNEFLPLEAENWIVAGNALRIDWQQVCPQISSEQMETYICGNPPYAGLSTQTSEQKDDLNFLFDEITVYWKSFDYVMAWFWKASLYIKYSPKCSIAFVSTNSICQGQLVPMFWKLILADSLKIHFAHTSFRWRNLAAHNAGVMVVIVGLIKATEKNGARLYEEGESGTIAKEVENINAYLVPSKNIWIEPMESAPSDRSTMYWGNKPVDDGNLLMDLNEALRISHKFPEVKDFLRPYYGSIEFTQGKQRFCIWVTDENAKAASECSELKERFDRVRSFRASSKAASTRPTAKFPHRFRQIQGLPGDRSIIVPIHTSEKRDFLPVGLLPKGAIISNAAYGVYNAPLWILALIASRLHLVWIATVCGKIKTDFRYSNTLGWNTFPVPLLSEQNKFDLTRCAEEILIAREAHFPSSIDDLYDELPEDLRRAHERNDEILERIYIGRRFKNDSERIEKLFELYTKMTAANASAGSGTTKSKRKTKKKEAQA